MVIYINGILFTDYKFIDFNSIVELLFLCAEYWHINHLFAFPNIFKYSNDEISSLFRHRKFQTLN